MNPAAEVAIIVCTKERGGHYCLSVPTVKTYRNRAFARLGIHFRNELFALVWNCTPPMVTPEKPE